MFEHPAPAEPPRPSLWDTWSLWLAIGYAVLLTVAALSVALGWQGIEDALDLRRFL